MLLRRAPAYEIKASFFFLLSIPRPSQQLDFLVLDDSWVMAFCDANSLAYDLPAQARAVLSGGAEIHWT